MKKSILHFILQAMSRMPFWMLYGISDVLYVLIYHVLGYRKKVVFKNLRNSFPEKSEAEIEQIAKEFYRYFPDIIVEVIKMFSIKPEQVKERIELLNPEEIYRHFDAGRAVIGVTAHYGNWELGIHRLSLMTDYERLVIYKPLNNNDINQIYNGVRTRFGATMVPMKQILRHIVRLKNTPHISMFVADQTPLYQDSDYFMTFLNQETLVYTGTERIAKMTNNPVVFCHIGRKPKRGHYFCKFTTLVETPSDYGDHEITKIHNEFTEKIIREQPPYWLWSHNRWKRQRKDKA
ncbi:lysophospholipid acyltransferase family protein [Sphingobacterium yanglingense]|uniref:KDO2-lipid IV(A) lauroyltransferase n=1 Tax=Sphingobacterium yanglingense TaxID=1437280 RepID=A0A4R6WGU2_9SPHI|nr:lysophospholipid acyltransferase family protein [Sphingobacterium yanglingense]TDQ79390.1 KDO2-lipid IV(A) lauroyltransferase [Sphingobacterium yanglingense]